jgi:hypothetical protein
LSLTVVLEKSPSNVDPKAEIQKGVEVLGDSTVNPSEKLDTLKKFIGIR